MHRSTRWLALIAGFSTVAAGTMVLPSDASAQRRAVSRPAIRPVVVRPVVVPVRPAYYWAPYYGYGMSLGWYNWGGWYPYGFSPYGFYARQYPYPPPYYRPYYGGYASSARLLVEPKAAEVYVDGHFVGTVDDFDGWAQRLTLPPGEHVLEIYLEGYRTYRQHVLFRPGASIRIQHALEPLPQGELPEERPTPSERAARPTPAAGYPPAPPSRRVPTPRSAESGTYGSLAIRVQPADAEVIVDGESWKAPEAGDLTLQLAEGRHTVEVRRDGFRPFRAEVQVRRGDTTTVNVSLSRNP